MEKFTYIVPSWRFELQVAKVLNKIQLGNKIIMLKRDTTGLVPK